MNKIIQTAIKEVWYFCSPEIINRVKRAVGDWKHVKVHILDEKS